MDFDWDNTIYFGLPEVIRGDNDVCLSKIKSTDENATEMYNLIQSNKLDLTLYVNQYTTYESKDAIQLFLETNYDNQYGIYLAQKMVGAILLDNRLSRWFSYDEAVALIIWVGCEFRRAGLASHATRLLEQEYFLRNEYQLNLDIVSTNEKSKNLAIKNGYVKSVGYKMCIQKDIDRFIKTKEMFERECR